MNKEIITKYQRCKDYALWYYFRYYPSIHRLKNKLNEKTLNNHTLVDQVFDDVWELFDDTPVLESKVQNLLFRNKNKNYIKNNLRQKLFNIDEIQTILDNFTTQGESLLDEYFVKRKIENFKLKNKSINYIKNKLIEQPEDKELVTNLIYESYWEEWEYEEMKNELNKLINKKLDKQKVIQKLLQKWFQYWDIKKLEF